MLPTVESYLVYLKQAIVRQCAGCSAPLCLACGDEVCESSKLAKGKSVLVQDDGAKEPGPPSRLLHCPEVQAIILGAGLAHFGDLFEEPKEKIVRSHDEGKKGNPKKKLKTSTDVPTVTNEPADSDSQPHWDLAKKSLLDGKGNSEFSLLDESPSPASSTPDWKSKSIPVDNHKPGKGTGYGGYDVKESTSWLGESPSFSLFPHSLLIITVIRGTQQESKGVRQPCVPWPWCTSSFSPKSQSRSNTKE